jgi:phenylacetaldehyde dehydrogenase
MNAVALPATVKQFMRAEKRLLIGGRWVAASSGERIPVLDPATGEVISEVASAGPADADKAVHAARQALHSKAWRDLAPDAREELIRGLADLIEQNADELAGLETHDNGMLYGFARHLNVMGAVGVLRYMAGWASKIEGSTRQVAVPIPDSQFFAYTAKEPVGVVAAILPWNVPVMLAAWKLGPALASGCTIVLKPAEETSLATLRLGELIEEAGFPPGVVNIITGYGETAGHALAAHRDVDKVSFTGSVATGKIINRTATDTLKRVTLELGGKSPVIVLDDADLGAAIEAAAGGIFMNAGQVCVAGSRVYAQTQVFDRFVQGLAESARRVKVGPGLDPASEMGPLVSQEQQQRVLGYIQEGVREGGSVAAGGHAPGRKGFFVEPTVLVNVTNRAKVVQEEIFGPVITVQRFEDIEEVVTAANDSAYGLGAYLWSRDISKVHQLVPRLRAGSVWINTSAIPHPALPHGGFKQSGFGRDLGRESLEQFLETKSVLLRVR